MDQRVSMKKYKKRMKCVPGYAYSSVTISISYRGIRLQYKIAGIPKSTIHYIKAEMIIKNRGRHKFLGHGIQLWQNLHQFPHVAQPVRPVPVADPVPRHRTISLHRRLGADFPVLIAGRRLDAVRGVPDRSIQVLGLHGRGRVLGLGADLHSSALSNRHGEERARFPKRIPWNETPLQRGGKHSFRCQNESAEIQKEYAIIVMRWDGDRYSECAGQGRYARVDEMGKERDETDPTQPNWRIFIGSVLSLLQWRSDEEREREREHRDASDRERGGVERGDSPASPFRRSPSWTFSLSAYSHFPALTESMH